MTVVRIRAYGNSGPLVIVLHGGPGAPGSMSPVARGLADSFRILEPMQRGSGNEPLTVSRHVADLDALVSSCGGARPAIVGHSWGAMLALVYAAAHPGHAASLALIGCGTFDSAARDRMRATCEKRMDEVLRRRLEALPEEFPDPDTRLGVLERLMRPLYSCDPAPIEPDAEACDARAHQETWSDMLRLQAEGVYPASFAAIVEPVIMLHGAVDPHPGRLIRASLEPYLPRLEYHEWDRCGHYPWLETVVRNEFFVVLRDWLARHSPRGSP